jgi:predicted Zn-dependent protease
MLTRKHAEQIFAKVLKYSTADETEAAISSVCYALTRFANNQIHQNVAEENTTLSVRVLKDRGTARVNTNKLDEDSIRHACENALALASLQPPDPDRLGLASPQTYRVVNRLHQVTAELSPRERAETVRGAIARAEKDGLTAAGVYSSGVIGSALLNSGGLSAFHEETVSEFSVTMRGESSSGWAKRIAPCHLECEPEVLAERAAQKALASREPKEIAPGRFTVILEPAAVLDLLGFFILDFSGLAVLEKRSCFTDRLGKKLFGENISIHDDVYHPRQSGAPFDGEGLPRQRVDLVKRGVVKNLVYARQTAHRMGQEPTGHGFPVPNEYGEAPLNIVMEGSRASLESLIRSTAEGLLITRLWYIREVDPYQKILTGMTRDGTFWIEKGELKHGVKNLRFNQSLIEMLAHVEKLSLPERASGEETFDMVVPAMKVHGFNFSSVTKF